MSPAPRTALLAAAAIAAAVTTAGCSGEEPAATAKSARATTARTATAPAPRRLWVDQDSVGGPCRDARPAAEAANPRTPWCTMSRAVGAAPRNAVVYVRRGTYPRLGLDGEHRGGWVTLAAAPHEAVTIHGIELNRTDWVRFRRLRFTGATNTIGFDNHHIEILDSDLTVATHVRPSSHLRFQGNRFHDLPGPPADSIDGVALWIVNGNDGQTTDVVIRGNRFSRLKNDAVFTDGTRITIDRNLFEHIQSPDNTWAHADVIQTQGAYDVHVTNNFATDNDSGILNSAAASHGWIIKNNLFIRSESQPIQLDNKLADLELVNNTFWGGGPVLLRWDPAAPRNRHAFVIANNIATRMDIDPRLRESQSHNYVLLDPFHHPAQGPGSRLGVAPHFAAPARGDYRLRSGSPGIDAGTSRNAPRRDRAGNARLGAVDVGAYEYRPHARLGVVSSGVR